MSAVRSRHCLYDVIRIATYGRLRINVFRGCERHWFRLSSDLSHDVVIKCSDLSVIIGCEEKIK